MMSTIADKELNYLPRLPKNKSFRIGCIGSGFIMADCHLVAYEQVGFNPVAISGRTRSNTEKVAERRGIKKVYDSYQELMADPSIEILDIAVPPHVQIEVIREAVKHAGHIKGILAQKPIAIHYKQAKEIVQMCEGAGIKLGVNQNMRYDQSIRACKSLLDKGL